MKRILLLLLFIASFQAILFSQVGINISTPHNTAMLEVSSTTKGVLIPRMPQSNRGVSEEGMLVYDTSNKNVYQNVSKTGAAHAWVPVGYRKDYFSFFYMPSLALDATALTVANAKINLYDYYKDQFSDTGKIESNLGQVAIPFFHSRYQLNYHIVGWDTDVLNIIGIGDNGDLEYQVIKASALKTFIDIVFVVK